MIKYLSVLNLIFFKMKSLFFLLISFIFFFAGNSYAQYFAESAITENIMDKDTASYAETELPNPKAEESSAENMIENETAGSDEKKAEYSDNKEGFFKETLALFSDVWNDGSWEVFIPLHAWHNRESYPKYKIDGYNEEPWGFGIGKYKMDYRNNKDGLLAIGFSDSNWHFEPLLLYTWQKIWRDKKDFFRFSAGYMAGFTTRKEWHWCPIPMALPIIGLEAGPVSFSNTYVPGLGKENGNVWFSWASIRF